MPTSQKEWFTEGSSKGNYKSIQLRKNVNINTIEKI